MCFLDGEIFLQGALGNRAWLVGCLGGKPHPAEALLAEETDEGAKAGSGWDPHHHLGDESRVAELSRGVAQPSEWQLSFGRCCRLC